MLKNIPKIAASHLKTNPNSPQSFTAAEAAQVTCATFWTKHALENKSMSVPYSRYTILHWKKYISPPLAMFSQNKNESFFLTPSLKWGKIAHTLCESEYLFETLGN